MTRPAASLVLTLLTVATAGVATAASTSPTENTYRAGIYSVRQDGKDRRLIALPEPSVSSFIRSPGGLLILYAREVDGVRALFAAERSGANAVRLSPPELQVSSGAFSPDGKTVAFTSFTECGWRCARSKLWITGRDGSGLRLLAEDAGWWHSWAPDGRRLAYAGGGGIYVLDLESGETTLAARGGDRPVWAPRGNRIAFTAVAKGYGVACFVNADGSRRRCTSGRSLTGLVWSRDARRVAFRQATPRLLGTVDSDARHLRSLGNHGRWARPAAWSPDGRRLAYTFSSGGSYGLVQVLRIESPRRSVRVVDERDSYVGDIRRRGDRISYVASRPEPSP